MSNGYNSAYKADYQQDNEKDTDCIVPLIDGKWEEKSDGEAKEKEVQMREERNTRKYSLLLSLLSITDSTFNLFVAFPIVVLYWRGTWQLVDVYLFPDDVESCAWFCFGIGVNISLIAYLVQPPLAAILEYHKKVEVVGSSSVFSRLSLGGFKYFLMTRAYLYVHGWAVVFYWRGVWKLLDLYLGTGWGSSLALYVVCQAITVCTLTVRSIIGAPLALQRDTDHDLLRSLTVFRVDNEKPCKYSADALFTLLVVQSSVVVIFRGIWNFLDYFIFPEDVVLSEVVSLVGGYISMLALFALQSLLSRISANLDLRPAVYKVIFEDIVMVVATWAYVLLWRGGWYLCLRYVIPEPVMGSWICHVIGAAALIGLQIFSVVAFNGIDCDGGYMNGSGIFATQYFEHYFHQWMQQPQHCTKSEEEEKVKAIGDVECADSDITSSGQSPPHHQHLNHTSFTLMSFTNSDAAAALSETISDLDAVNG